LDDKAYAFMGGLEVCSFRKEIVISVMKRFISFFFVILRDLLSYSGSIGEKRTGFSKEVMEFR
jgi:hypothetical protein